MRYLLCILTGLAGLVALPAGTPIDWPARTQKPFAGAAIPDLGLQPLLVKDGTKITTKEVWQKRRQELAAVWQERLGPLPAKPAQLDVRIEQTEACDGYTRKLVSFLGADGDRILAYLLIPDGLKQGEQRPAVVVFHPTTQDTLREPVGLGNKPSPALGIHLVRRGYVVLAPQCYIMKGAGPRAQAVAVGKQWQGLTGMGKMLFDASRCVDFLAALACVDPARIGCMGHSLGAKEVLYALAFEQRYQAGVFNEGGIGLRMSNWTDPWYLTADMKKHIPALEHHQLLALCAPRPILILGGDSADGDASWPFVHAALPVYRLLGAEERIGLINHHGKHTFPQEARRHAYRWLDHWLQHRPAREEDGPP